MSSGGLSRLPAEGRRRFTVWPTTRLGTWALALGAASMMLLLVWPLLGRLGGVPGLALGLSGGVAALIAILRRGERAVAVLAALLPFSSVVMFVLAELLLGDD